MQSTLKNGAKLRSGCSRKAHLPALHYAGRHTVSAAALLSLALRCLLKMEAPGAVLPGGSSILLEAAAAAAGQNC